MATASMRAAALASLLAAPLAVGLPADVAPAADDATIVHLLNRLAYGPRPGDVARVRAQGVSAWIRSQLDPAGIDDAALALRLAALPTLALDTPELVARYDLPREAKREIQAKRAQLGDDAAPEQARALRLELTRKYGAGMQGPPRQVLVELQSAKLLRAVYSERQLDEVMVDFWLNHFNVFAGKGPLKFGMAEYEREVIRPHAWGRFEDLLRATAESPAMLFYLDNWLSADPKAVAAAEARRRQARAGRARRARFGRAPAGAEMPAETQPRMRRGLNENYAREIMELHTLGVDGGYTQQDVTELARCFTGWSIRGLRQGRPEFYFDERVHDRGDKLFLGHRISAAGKREGDSVIHILATHPATARFVSWKLVRRFVADDPPPALVERAAQRFRSTQGDIRSVVETIVTSPEFLGAQYRSAKVKTPFEFVASALRASGAEVSDSRDLLRRLEAMGMPLYMQQPPTGYKDTADAWVSASGLLARLNLALDLVSGRVRGVRPDSAGWSQDGDAGLSALAARLLPGGLGAATRATLERESAGADGVRIAGLILGSPEFQRR